VASARLVVGFLRTGVAGVAGSGLEQREGPVGVRDGFGIHVVGGLPGHELLPCGPAEHALDREHLCCLEPGRDITAEGGGPEMPVQAVSGGTPGWRLRTTRAASPL
jgi:hypothetical protein